MRVASILVPSIAPVLTTAIGVVFQLSPSATFNPSSLPPSTHTTLYKYGNHLTAPLTRRNTFEYNDLELGSYLVTVQCRDFNFSPLRLDVTHNGTDDAGQEQYRVDAWQTFWGNAWSNTGEWLGGETVAAAATNSVPVTVGIKPNRPMQYYQERTSFSLIQFFKNPMMLMAVVSLGLVVGLPYLMENMDEETKAEFQEMQKSSPLTQATNPAAKLQNFDFAGWMASKSTADISSKKS